MEKLRHKATLENVPVRQLTRKLEAYYDLYDKTVESTRITIDHDSLVESTGKHELIFLNGHVPLISYEISFSQKTHILHLILDDEVTTCLSTDDMIREVKIYEVYGGTQQ